MILRNPAFQRDSFFIVLLVLWLSSFPMGLAAQGVFGHVADVSSHLPVKGATISCLYPDTTSQQTISDSLGYFNILSPFAGRVKLIVQAPGFTDQEFTGILLDGYSTLRLDVFLEKEIIALKGVTVVAHGKAQAYSVSHITAEDFQRIAGNFEDPVRIAHSAPGIVMLNDQANHFSARGQSPVFNSWYLEGLPIVNPNHTSNAGTFSDLPTQYGGGVNMFSAQILGETDIYTGITPNSFQRNSGAAINMHLHESASPEWRAKAGLIGMEVGGGAKIGSNGILDINLRYSFTGLLTDLGADFGGEKIGFSDGVVSYLHQNLRHKLKLFAWAGHSYNQFDHIEAAEDRKRYKDFLDIDYANNILGAGCRYDFYANRGQVIRAGLAFSTNQSDYDKQNQFGVPSLPVELNEKIAVLASFAETSFSHARHWVSTLGIDHLLRSYNTGLYTSLPFREDSRLRLYFRTSVQLAPWLTMELGADELHSLRYNHFNTGFQAGLRFPFSRHWESFVLFRHSAEEPLLAATQGIQNNYFLADAYETGLTGETQRHRFSFRLYFQQSHHWTWDYIQSGLPYYLADYPGNRDNFGIRLATPDGESENKGMEFSWTYTNPNGWGIGFNQSVFDSRRGTTTTKQEPGLYNGKWASHFHLSKEWIKDRGGKKRIWNISFRGIWNGGLWEQTIDTTLSKALETTYYSSTGLYDQHLPAFKRIDAGLTRTTSTKTVRWRWSLDIQNLMGSTNIAYHYYDPFLQKVVAQEQLGLIPVLSLQASW